MCRRSRGRITRPTSPHGRDSPTPLPLTPAPSPLALPRLKCWGPLWPSLCPARCHPEHWRGPKYRQHRARLSSHTQLQPLPKWRCPSPLEWGCTGAHTCRCGWACHGGWTRATPSRWQPARTLHPALPPALRLTLHSLRRPPKRLWHSCPWQMCVRRQGTRRRRRRRWCRPWSQVATAPPLATYVGTVSHWAPTWVMPAPSQRLACMPCGMCRTVFHSRASRRCRCWLQV